MDYKHIWCSPSKKKVKKDVYVFLEGAFFLSMKVENAFFFLSISNKLIWKTIGHILTSLVYDIAILFMTLSLRLENNDTKFQQFSMNNT